MRLGANDVVQRAEPPSQQAFEAEHVTVAIAEIRLLRPTSAGTRQSSKYAQIAASVAEVGLVEPPIVARHPHEPGVYLLLDGHLRIDILRERGTQHVVCLVATDDEAFTYNKRISRLAAVQEHRMILKAIERSVPEERLARALNIDISTLRHKKRALQGVCPEAVDILKDKQVALSALALLKRMLPLRQIEVAEMMVTMNRYSKPYIEALLAATPAAQLVPDAKPKAPKGITAEQVAVMERETAQLDREIKVAEQSFGPDHMQLVFARGYVAKLLENERILRWLTNHQPDVLAEFRKITEMEAAPA